MENSQFADGFRKRPHIVILGAGASIAAIPHGDKNGRKISGMDGFIENLGLQDVLSDIKLKTESKNLEDIYSELYERVDCSFVRNNLESKIFEYFSLLEIPDEPTIYDYLLLSLRKKDCIASFNWDDLIIQAYQRVVKIVGKQNMPELIFLHGNIGVGYCPEDYSMGSIMNTCKKCGNNYNKTKLLYPIKNKNYQDTISTNEWGKLSEYLRRASIITIFGYKAPTTDVEARNLLLDSFNCFEGKRFFDIIEIIEKPGLEKDLIYNRWKDFISVTSHHYEIKDSFFSSSLAEAPRRSVEFIYKRDICGWWGEPSIIFKDCKNSFEDLNTLIKPLIEAENDGNFEVI